MQFYYLNFIGVLNFKEDSILRIFNFKFKLSNAVLILLFAIIASKVYAFKSVIFYLTHPVFCQIYLLLLETGSNLKVSRRQAIRHENNIHQQKRISVAREGTYQTAKTK